MNVDFDWYLQTFMTTVRWEDPSIITGIIQMIVGCSLSLLVAKLLKYVGFNVSLVVIVLELFRRNEVFGDLNYAGIFDVLSMPATFALRCMNSLVDNNPVHRNFIAGFLVGLCSRIT